MQYRHRSQLFVIMLTLAAMLVMASCASSDDAAKTPPKVENKETAMTTAQLNPNAPPEELAKMRRPVRSKDNPIVTIATDYGNMTLELWRDVAPAHADSFLSLTKKGFYKGTIFHRIIKHFMIQGGDPTGTGTGNAGYYLKAEFNSNPHEFGTLSMARAPDPNSASCQFFICLERNQSTASLDGQYTVFGQLLKGYDALVAIGNVAVGGPQRSTPVNEIVMRDVYVSDAEGKKLEEPKK